MNSFFTGIFFFLRRNRTLLSAFSGMLRQGLSKVLMGRELTAIICACWRAGLIHTLSKRRLQAEDAIKHMCNGGAISYPRLPLWSARLLDLHSGSGSEGATLVSALSHHWFLSRLVIKRLELDSFSENFEGCQVCQDMYVGETAKKWPIASYRTTSPQNVYLHVCAVDWKCQPFCILALFKTLGVLPLSCNTVIWNLHLHITKYYRYVYPRTQILLTCLSCIKNNLTERGAGEEGGCKNSIRLWWCTAAVISLQIGSSRKKKLSWHAYLHVS